LFLHTNMSVPMQPFAMWLPRRPDPVRV
jgi:hypothetical protein